MKVLFITREYPPFDIGGIAVHTFNLVTSISKLGVSCKVLSFGDETFSSEAVTFVNPSSSVIARSNVSLALNAKIPFDIIRFSKIANRILKNEQFDVVHVEEPYVGAFVKPSGRQIKVTTFHTTSFGEVKAMLRHSLSSYGLKRASFYSSMGLFFELKGIASSTTLIVPTLELAGELRKVYRTSINKIKIIQNGVDIPEPNKTVDKSDAKRKLGLSPETTLIINVGRLIDRKRVDLLVKAAKTLQKEKLNQFHVAIVGEGPERSNVARLVNELGLQSVIELPGRVSEEQKDLYYRAADIFVLTSSYEGFPLTMLEAMSYGVAIVASRIESVSSLREGIDGLKFSSGDFFALSVSIKGLLIDKPLRTRLSASALEFAQKRSWQRIAEETLKVYETIVR